MQDQEKIISQRIKRAALRSLAAVRLPLILLLGLIFWFPAARAQATVDSDKSLEKVSLQLKWHHQFQFAGYYAAVEKGYYNDAGLEVLLKEGRAGLSFTDEVVSGRADFGIEMPIILLERLVKGKPVVVLAAIFQHSPEIIIARKDSGIESPQDLVLRRLELRPKGNIESRAMLINEGIQLEDVEIVDHSWDINYLISKKVDASAGYITDRPFMLEQQGVPYTVMNPLTYGINFYGDCLFTSEMEIKEQPERVRAFYEASLRGWTYAMENPDEIIEIILTKYNPGLSKEFLRFEAQAMQKLMMPKFIEIGHMNQGRWKHVGDTFVKLGMLKPDYSLKGFMYDPNPKPDDKWIYWTIGITGAILFIVVVSVVILIYFNRRLNKAVRLQTLKLSETNQQLIDDITRRRKAEEALRSEKEFTETALNAQQDTFFLFEQATGRAMRWNRAFNDITGYTDEEISRMPAPGSYYGPDDMKRAAIFIEKVLRTGIGKIELQLICKGGRKVPTEYNVAVIKDEAGSPKYIISIGRDIAERKKAEGERQKMQKLESIGVLAGGIAHDFNNILSGILNYVYLSKMHIERESKEYKSLESAEKAIYRATNLTRQLLTFAKGGTPIKKTASIIELIKESAEFALKGSNVKCEYIVADDLWPVEVDEGQINQVIHNLILNADQAMPEGGTIRIHVENFNLISGTGLPLKEEKYIKVIVQDQGTGISEEHLQKLFDPYFTTKEMGRGLGLSIIYSIIKQHDGHISAESDVGVGTTFKIYLPASEKQVEKNETAEYAPVAGKGKILFMDDEEMIRESVGKLLTVNGYDVEYAKDGEEAIELYKKTMETSKPFDAVILDLTIRGGMGGKGAMKKLKQLDPDVRAIVSSGYSNDPVMANYKEHGFSDVFYKASNHPDDLYRILNKAIKR